MFYKLPSFSTSFTGAFNFKNYGGRCFRSFISVSSLNNKRIKSSSLTHFLFPYKQKEVFNFSSVHSNMKMDENIKSSSLKLVDYDCIGFDLDNTLCEYNLNPLIQMEYNALVSFLCEYKGYPAETFKIPLTLSDMDFLQRGLMLDLRRGNILKVNFDGTILRALNGSREMSDEEIKIVYGDSKKWEVTDSFCDNLISTWNGPLAAQLRPLLDFFDISASLVFARAVDFINSLKEGSERYSIHEDILSALIHTYKRDNFQTDKSKFFYQMKRNQAKYTNKCDPLVIEWLKRLKSENKVTFLLTGSNVDFASLSAQYCLGEDWRELFDIVICYARKPGFFINSQPFISLDGYKEITPVKTEELIRGNMYSQGNWTDLVHFFSNLTGKSEPKCLYFGDNVVQDIYTPSRFCGCDTVAVIEELKSEIPAEDCLPWLKSNEWGSYFKYKINNTVWGRAIRSHSKICIPSVKYIANFPLNYEFQTFSNTNNYDGEVTGFHPVIPVSLKDT